MPGSNEGRVSEVSPIERMTQVVRYGAQTGKKALQAVGKLGALAVTTGVSQFAQGAIAHPTPTTEGVITNSTTFDQNPNNQFYIYGGLGVIGAMIVTIVFIFPLLRRLCCPHEDGVHNGSTKVTPQEFRAFVKQHSRNRDVGREVAVQAPEVVSLDGSIDGVNSTVTLVTNDGDIPVSFTVGDEDDQAIYQEIIDPPSEFAVPDNELNRLQTVIEIEETNEDDLTLLMAETRRKREDLRLLEKATKVVAHMIAHPEKRETLSVRYKDLLEAASHY